MTRVLTGISLQQASAGETVDVTGAELHYLKNVRRHTVGDTLRVFDGQGNSFDADIACIDNVVATLVLRQRVLDVNQPASVHILAAVPKEKIFDDVVRKLSELGVARLSPLVCERSSVVPGAPRVERWRRIAEQSMRQCRRSLVLDIDDPQPFAESLVALEARQRFLFHPSGEVAGGTLFSERVSGEIAVLIGPEGGFSEKELLQATEHSFRSIRLGNSILRMETAILVAAVSCIAMLGGYDE